MVRKRLESRRVSFASGEQTRELTGMEIGGVTPFALPEHISVWVDARVMTREQIVLGAGTRDAKIIVPPAVFEHLENVEVIELLGRQLIPLSLESVTKVRCSLTRVPPYFVL